MPKNMEKYLPFTYVDELSEIFNQRKHRFFLDIPKLQVPPSTVAPVRQFMSFVNREHDYVYQQFLKCKNIPGLIPVISYSDSDDITSIILKNDIEQYHNNFPTVAIRLTPPQYNKVADFTSIPFNKNDYLLLDIGDNAHTNPVFKKIYEEIKELKHILGIITFIINSNRPTDFYNKNIIDGKPIQEIDNSLLQKYHTPEYNFNGFGDYACIANALPSSGGSISPAGIYYSQKGNYFVGYKGRTQSLSEFKNYIAPSIVNSSYWSEFTNEHHQICPGCDKIHQILNGAPGKSQSIWKGITMGHYIYTVDQIMQGD